MLENDTFIKKVLKRILENSQQPQLNANLM